ncbi:DUF6783 domain-containing protein [Fusicatenibacter sp.]
MRTKSPTKRDLQLTKSLFQTLSSIAQFQHTCILSL